jgi:hypothetical protein
VTAPSIGVLLPVRLETRFVAPRATSAAPWRMRLRVVPDAVSITNHDDLGSEMELNAVEAMWRAAGGQRLESANGRRAWRALAAAVGPERAAWLARTFPPVTGAEGQVTINRPTQTRTEMRAPRVMGLPPTIEIWIARGGQSAARASTLTVLAEAIDLDLDNPNSTDQPWWSSFPEAVRVGLAAEIDLGPARPTDIDTVYAIGIGGGDPGPLLTAQADSGELGVVPPGAATSSVDGEPAVAIGDVDTWRQLVTIGTRAQAGTLAVSSALAGRPVLRGVVGGESDHRPLNGALVGALWPALWGHSLANVSGYGSRADELGLWAAANLVPEGPLPSMRVGTQPYGLLPATSLRRWTRAAGDPAIEDQLVPLVRELVGAWTAAAERGAAMAPDALRRLVRNPTATRYEWRWMMPTTLAQAVSFRHNQPLPAAELGTWWTRRSGQVPRLVDATTPARALISVGWGHDVDLRLVEPDDLPAGTDTGRGLARLATASVAELLAAGPVEGRPRASSPWGTSVLTELARHSLLQSAAVVARTAAGVARPVVEPVSADRRSATEIDTWAARLETTDVSRRRDATSGVRRNVIAGLQALAGASTADIDRGLRAALDTATYRLDPWATAIAWRRLQALAAAPRTLGVYSWVDAPMPRTSEGGQQYLLAPSTEQAAVAAVLRDRALRDPDADRWQMNLTSDAVRAAMRLAEEVRDGSHPSESLGRMVEAIVIRPIVIDRLRATFPLIHGVFRREMSIRRVCDGAAVLDAAQNRPGDLTQLGVRVAEVQGLVELAVAVDALADLHVAEAALGVVRGRSAAVSAATSAAAGQAVPPIFDVVSTPRAGRVANTVALLVLPDAPAPTGAQPSPAAIADPAVAAYLDELAGAANGPNWTWRTVDATGQPAGTVTLAQVRLRPCDTVGLGRGNLRDVVRVVSGAAGLDPADAPGHATVRSLAAALAGVPAARQDTGATADESDAAAAELAGRYLALRTAAVAAAVGARAVADGTSTEAELRRALGRIARWGITPLGSDVADAAIGGLAARLHRAAESLERRVADAPLNLAGATGPLVAQAIGALVAPEGPYAVYARLPANAFVGLRAEPTGGQAPRLDPDWLETVAPVRPAVARLEAIQLDQRLTTGGRPLRAWSSRLGDPWQKVVPPPSDVEVDRPSRLIAVFGPPGVLPARPVATTAGRVAVAVIDRFAETIPDTESVAGVAFSHDLPPARAPQAVVLAVPPVVDQELTTDVLVDIVTEVRDLVRTRMADAAEIGAAIDSLHGATLPASGRAAVDLGGR